MAMAALHEPLAKMREDHAQRWAVKELGKPLQAHSSTRLPRSTILQGRSFRFCSDQLLQPGRNSPGGGWSEEGRIRS